MTKKVSTLQKVSATKSPRFRAARGTVTLVTYGKDGRKSGTIPVARSILEARSSHDLLHQVATGLLANQRRATAHTKTRGEVRGGGRKPWRQKGTGRARAGSIRSPLWRGGGTVFGPRNTRNYHLRLPFGMRRTAIRQVLAEKVRSGEIVVVTALDLPEPKTRLVEEWLQRLPVKEGRILLVADPDEEVRRATGNLPYLVLRTPATVNLLDLMIADSLVITKKSWGELEQRYA